MYSSPPFSGSIPMNHPPLRIYFAILKLAYMQIYTSSLPTTNLLASLSPTSMTLPTTATVSQEMSASNRHCLQDPKRPHFLPLHSPHAAPTSPPLSHPWRRTSSYHSPYTTSNLVCIIGRLPSQSTTQFSWVPSSHPPSPTPSMPLPPMFSPTYDPLHSVWLWDLHMNSFCLFF